MVIVGAGHCGGRAALELRDAGWIGPIHLVGEEAAAPYERPALSKGLLTGDCSAAQCTFLPDIEIEHLGIQRHVTRATRLDLESRAVVTASGDRLNYGALLIATGGRVRRLAVLGTDLPQVLTLRSLADALRLASRLARGQRLAIVGGGFIGLEVAASAIRNGCVVTVIEAASRLMGRAVPESVACSALALHEARGVEVRLGLGVERIVEFDTGTRVLLSDASHVDADTVLVGIGIDADTSLAREAGLQVRQGVVVNAELETSRTGVFAAGDVAEFPAVISGASMRQETWHNAQTQARTAALNMLGHHIAHAAPPWFWSDQYDHQVQVAGEPAIAVANVARELGEDCRLIFYSDASHRLVGVCGWGPTGRIAKEFMLARMLVERGLAVSAESLRDPATKLKALLQASQQGSLDTERALTSP